MTLEGGGVGRGGQTVPEAVKHSVIQHLLITSGTNVQADTHTTCIRPKLPGASHVLFGGLLIGPNKDPQGQFAFERSVSAGEGGGGDVRLAGTEPETGNRPFLSSDL